MKVFESVLYSMVKLALPEHKVLYSFQDMQLPNVKYVLITIINAYPDFATPDTRYIKKEEKDLQVDSFLYSIVVQFDIFKELSFQNGLLLANSLYSQDTTDLLTSNNIGKSGFDAVQYIPVDHNGAYEDRSFFTVTFKYCFSSQQEIERINNLIFKE
ncbi:MAG: hypothetical protein OMM_06613 [Candidatus Magnetoglobus multicellularis str. Araruama]|uniref:Phage neck terminator protein gp12-like domain-containing protein n=1 Tax=Candidatus Magnetoglobus multicellularis str. Araruama TaxID=890399 RepID=A0A1V1PH25_9BACT|nr:MAG: hypothetical protein OMM_06613 [Candidatus Magnetoglobus multicellularis str. Araruama]